MNEELMTLKEVMAKLRVSKGQIYILLRTGRLRAVNVAKRGALRVRYRFLKSDVDNILGDHS